MKTGRTINGDINDRTKVDRWFVNDDKKNSHTIRSATKSQGKNQTRIGRGGRVGEDQQGWRGMLDYHRRN